jgi:hypothetical protein
MTCRIDRLATEDRVILSLSGRITAESLEMLKGVLRRETRSVALDLKGVRLADGDAVRFLAVNEANGIELLNCPAYVREWIAREGAQKKPGASEPGQ